MKKLCLFVAAGMVVAALSMALGAAEEAAPAKAPPLSAESATCVDCHKIFNPGIVEDWLTSRHARMTPKAGLAKGALERRVSSPAVPERLQNVAVGCYECHGLNAAAHKDNFDHFDTKINTVVTPQDCAVCHSLERGQYGQSKKAHALDNLVKNPVYSLLVSTVTAVKAFKDGRVTAVGSTANAKNETCYACHGTEVKVQGLRKIGTSLGDVEVPNLINFPNQGVGRINPDGSLGACTSCHPRHGFSIEVARKPYTCSQCHGEPDTPAYHVYQESKHGNIFSSRQRDWRFGSVPWVLGRDFSAPTCAACHASLVTTGEGDLVRQRTHNFGDRLWVRIFGLPYSHPQPREGATHVIKNKDGLPLPTTFSGDPALEFLIDEKEQRDRKAAMEKFCIACHSTSWAGRHFEKFQATVKEADRMVVASTGLMGEGWEKKAADPSNPFDEKLEHQWLTQWLINANSVRYSSAMGGPDFATFKNGWWSLTKTLEGMREAVKAKKD